MGALSTVAFLLLGCGALLKPPDPSRRLEIATKGSIFESSNGFKYIVLPESELNLVRVDIRYPVGSAHDPEGKEGLAHLVEHLLFEVVVDRVSGPSTVRAELAKYATYSNAETTKDHTQYITEGKPENLHELLRLETERIAIGCQGIDEAAVVRQREIVLNETRQGTFEGDLELQRIVLAAVFPAGHPYGRRQSLSSISQLTRDDVCSFIREHYTRGKAYVVIAGQIDDRTARATVAATFNRLPARSPSPPPIASSVAPRPARLRVKANVRHTTIVATWALPPAHSKEYRAVAGYPGLIARNLGGYSMLYKWGHSASARQLGGVHAPQAAVSVALYSPKNVDQAISFLEKSVRRAMPRRAGKKSETGWEYPAFDVLTRYEGIRDRARMFLDLAQYEPDIGYIAGLVDEVRQAPAHAIVGQPREWFAWDRVRIVVLEPDAVAADGRVGSMFAAADHQTRGAPIDPSSADVPVPVIVSANLRIDAERYVTKNGLTVVLWPHARVPVVKARLIVSSGAAHEPRDGTGLARYQGADARDLDELIFGHDSLSIRVEGLIAMMSAPLRFPGNRFSDEKRDRLKEYLALDEVPEDSEHWSQYYTALYGAGHPYARRPLSSSDLDAIDYDRVKRWGREHVQPANSTLIIAGQFDPELVKRHITYQTDHVSRGQNSPEVS